MIDAYEIGIQLLLQDDVSAGLAVISRELAEVDRAIASTSAELAGLVQEAGKAMTAVPAGVGHHAAPVATDEQHPETVDEHIGQRQPVSEVVQQFSERSAEQAAAPATKADRTAPEAVVTPAPVGGTPQPEEPSMTRQRAVPSAPTASTAVENKTLVQHARQLPTETEAPRSVAPMPPGPTTAQPSELAPLSARDVRTAVPDERRRADAPSAPVALTSSVSRVRKPEAAIKRTERARHQAGAGSAGERERPAAPWSGVEQIAPRGEAESLPVKAAAPRSPEQEASGLGSGTVMLDGRLVGEWLSNHMSREASRPPAGTSFFDPRQTPAWHVSGAL